MELLAYVAIVIVSIVIAIAPLFIWRNTSRTNGILILVALKQGVSKDALDRIIKGDGGDLGRIINGGGYVSGHSKDQQDPLPAEKFWKKK